MLTLQRLRLDLTSVQPASPLMLEASAPVRPLFWTDGSRIDPQPPGWIFYRPRRISADLYLVDIDDAARIRRTWFVDHGARLLGHRPELLPPRAMSALRRHLADHDVLELHTQAGSLLLDRAFLSQILLNGLEPSPDGLLIRDAAGFAIPLRLSNGDPVPALDPGWSSRLVFTGLAPVLMVDLVSDTGAELVWYIDRTGLVLGSAAGPLSDLLEPGLAAFLRQRDEWAPGRMAHDLAGTCLLNLTMQQQLQPLLHRHAPPAAPAQSDPGADPAMLPIGTPLTVAGRVDPREPGCIDRIGGGWSNVAGDCVASGQGASLSFELPWRPSVACLSLELRPIGQARRVTITLDGWDLAAFPLDPYYRSTSERRDVWIPVECLHGPSLRLDLRFDVEGHAVACALVEATLSIGPAVAPIEIPPVADLATCFGSLGPNSEFGFVQRILGAEPLGLFRFGACHDRRALAHLLDTDFAGLGRPGSLTAEVRQSDIVRSDGAWSTCEEFYLTDRSRAFSFHTWKGPAHGGEAEALEANRRTLTYLTMLMREDLEAGEKIWVYIDTMRDADLHEMLPLHQALNRKRPNRMLWITPASEGRPAGSVEWVAPNLLRGYLDSSFHDTRQLDRDAWRRLLTDAYCAYGERARPAC